MATTAHHLNREVTRDRERDRERDKDKGLSLPSRILYVRELPKDLDQKGCEELFSKERGFVAVRRLPFFAFVEFLSVEDATEALQRLRDYRLRPHDRPLVIDYDKDASASPSSSKKRKAPPEFDSYRERERDRYPPERERSISERDRERERERERERDFHSRLVSEREREQAILSPAAPLPPYFLPFTPREREKLERLKERDRIERERDRRLPARPDDDLRARSRDRSTPPFLPDHPYAPDLLLHANLLRGLPFPGLPSLYGQGTPYSPAPPPPPISQRERHDPHGTLFVGNLPSDVTERELSILFRFMPGFVGVRLIVREGKPPICFADFVDYHCASMCVQTLDGFKLDREHTGLAIEFDKGSKADFRDRERDREKDRDRERERERERDRERDHRR